jgi:tRNA nucleotidyltransferase (CCA-adding enzyme)
MKVYLVGGAVRDRLLGLKPGDRDFCVTGATPEEMTELGYQCVGRDFPVFLHPKTHEEYALARTERKKGHGYTGFICDFSPDIPIEEDLIRRDLTINAIAQDENGGYVDPCHGMLDIEKRILRHVSDAFTEDPLRVLRVARFLASLYHLGFKVAPETTDLCRRIVDDGELAYLTAERIWLETEKALKTRNPEKYYEYLAETGALKVIMPELDELRYLNEDPVYHPEGTCFAHTMLTLRKITALTRDPVTRFAMVLHDLGKIVEFRSDTPSEHRHRHEGEPLVKKLCERIKAPKAYIKLALIISRYHFYNSMLNRDPQEINELFLNSGSYKNPLMTAVIGQCIRADYFGRAGEIKTPFMGDYFLNFILMRAATIKNQEVLNDGFKGAAITTELNRRRLEKIISAQKELKNLYPEE